ncbi:NAD-dependent succinate-semialdehyde dehydrogenase [Rhodococcus sp. ACT016]|uniref:NAD-dependent succinate-semialdehyde dehydrogenase n=1 Tax=Rhodococcus sp. ACT016 TaxID=3134808 RepID=UPI003D2DB861
MSTLTATSIVDSVPTDLLIAGRWVPTDTRIAVDNPATGEVIAHVADATAAHGASALHAAHTAAAEWSATDPRYRSDILRRAFELVQARSEELALLITTEMGKPLAEARGEVTYAAEFLRWFSEEAVRIAGRYSQAPLGGTRLITIKQPVGPVLAITPWNFPLAMGTRKVGPALAAGCTVIIKPSEFTPLTTLEFGRILLEAGVPDGVVNIITTSDAPGVCTPLIADERLRKITFTGSTPVGRKLIEQSAHNVQRVSMELGGNAPFIVCDDADLDRAVDGAMLAKMRNNGEACTAANRFIVHRSVAEQFTARLSERMCALVVGNGVDAATQLGPLINENAVTKVRELVDDAVARGARAIAPDTAPREIGYFHPPTVLTDVPPSARIMSEEVFGPVAPVTTFDTDDEALRLANATEYGLVGYVFTENISRAVRLAEGLQTGMVGLNQGVVSNPAAPFGGVKASGTGREGGTEGIEEYLETKYVGLAL